MDKNTDIWAIQYYPDAINTALSLISSDDSIVYSNCISRLYLSEAEITGRMFDTFLCSEKSKLLIMLMRARKISKNDLLSLLDSKNIPYRKSDYVDVIGELYVDDDTIPEIWFANGYSVLKEACIDSINRGILKCTYYRNVNGAFEWGASQNGDFIPIDRFIVSGVLVFYDKVVMIVNQEDSANTLFFDDAVLQATKECKIACTISNESSLSIYVERFSERLKNID